MESEETPQQTKTSAQSSDYPVQLTIAYPASQSRLMALFSLPFFLLRIVLLIPQIIVLYFVQLAAFIVAWLNVWAVLFTGHSSAGMHSFVVGSARWSVRTNAYLLGLTDKYPPFRMNP